jgi:NAD(P)-dependent dehydrogenase (short-subunit alcohol dehydrogenase family)
MGSAELEDLVDGVQRLIDLEKSTGNLPHALWKAMDSGIRQAGLTRIDVSSVFSNAQSGRFSKIMNVFITGNSSGLGLGLTEALMDRQAIVWGMSRSGCPLKPRFDDVIRDRRQDLGQLSTLTEGLDRLLSDCLRLDLVVLNAGLLGRIQDIHQTDVHDLEHLMRVNVWANKLILDWLIERQLPVNQVVAISSGAAVNMNYGWGGYSISKSALNNLVQLYAHEMTDTHLSALAPGLVDTAMQDYLCGEVDSQEFPSVKKLQDARGTKDMPDARRAAETILDLLDDLRDNQPSGGFVDIRQI